MRVASLVGGILALAISAHAGWFGSESSADPAAELAKLFGKNAAFTATASMSVVGSIRGEKYAAEFDYKFLNGLTRTELDMAKTKSGESHAEAMQQLAALGVNRIVTVYRPDKKLTYVVYPGLASYCALPDKDVSGKAAAAPRLSRKAIGRETVDGHACIKSLITVSEADETTQEFTVWEAVDLKNFPIQSTFKVKGDAVTMRFRDVKWDKPAAALFEPPVGFTSYDSVQDMMVGAVQQLLGK